MNGLLSIWGGRAQPVGHFLAMEDRLYLDRRIHEMLSKGKKPATIAHELNCQLSRVYYQRLKFNKGLDWCDQPRAGAPRKVSPTTARLVTRVLKRKDVQTPKRAAVKLKTSHHLDISANTVRRTLKRERFRYRIKPLKPLVNRADEVARVNFARARRGKGFWERVWWSDEKAFEIHNEPRGIWVQVGDKVPVRKKGVVPPTIRVWGAISHEGKSKLYKIPSYWTAEDYKTHLEKKALPDIREKSKTEFIFEHDGDGSHRGKVVENFLKNEGIKVLDDLPAHSPDIPPIENMWKRLMDNVKYRNPQTKDGFGKYWRRNGTTFRSKKFES